MKIKYTNLMLLIATILAIFIVRTVLATKITMPRTAEIFDTLTVTGALFIVLNGYRTLRRSDWIIALILGAVVGAGMLFATLFSPYPFFGLVNSNMGQALIRGTFTILGTLGGLVIMRQGGPVQLHAANGDWRNTSRGILVGLVIGLPFAVLNVFALQFTQGHPIDWQNPLAALLDALQPGLVEEVIYRFALWGLLWLVLRNSLPKQAVWLAGLLSMLVHNYSHFDDLFLQSPMMAFGMGAVLALFWGLPPLILARCRGLESAIAFHWIQDAVRFLAGF
ncbi:MAG: hypothetical protein C3F07_07945 [Anaerolineales bacterium]|nr:CPBP family intramembrane metalloprotease [Anaerolineae bacterium]PWB74329.1 MAG: hypothetical protein C3F07_07945 [Anaerolineales bacterium]